MTSTQVPKEEFYLKKEEGQLRYWTSDMCSHSPHLFDFVVTVRVSLLSSSSYLSLY